MYCDFIKYVFFNFKLYIVILLNILNYIMILLNIILSSKTHYILLNSSLNRDTN